MSPAQPLACPPALTGLMRRFLAEEATGELRHDIRNRLTALRNAAFYVHKKLEKQTALVAEDPRLLDFLQRIDLESGAIADLLSSKLPPISSVEPRECGTDEVTAMLGRLALPASVTLQPGEVPVRVRGNVTELQLAVYCLVENAFETGVPPVAEIRVRPLDAGWVVIEVEDGGPDFSPGQGSRLGPGLLISKRVAERWGGALELSHSSQRALAALKLRAA